MLHPPACTRLREVRLPRQVAHDFANLQRGAAGAQGGASSNPEPSDAVQLLALVGSVFPFTATKSTGLAKRATRRASNASNALARR